MNRAGGRCIVQPGQATQRSRDRSCIFGRYRAVSANALNCDGVITFQIIYDAPKFPVGDEIPAELALNRFGNFPNRKPYYLCHDRPRMCE